MMTKHCNKMLETLLWHHKVVIGIRNDATAYPVNKWHRALLRVATLFELWASVTWLISIFFSCDVLVILIARCKSVLSVLILWRLSWWEEKCVGCFAIYTDSDRVILVGNQSIYESDLLVRFFHNSEWDMWIYEIKCSVKGADSILFDDTKDVIRVAFP